MELIDKNKLLEGLKKMKQGISAFPFVPIEDVEFLVESLEVKEVDLRGEVDIEDAVHGTVDFPFIGYDFPNIYPNYKELKEYCNRKGIKDNDKVKLIIIKDM